MVLGATCLDTGGVPKEAGCQQIETPPPLPLVEAPCLRLPLLDVVLSFLVRLMTSLQYKLSNQGSQCARSLCFRNFVQLEQQCSKLRLHSAPSAHISATGRTFFDMCARCAHVFSHNYHSYMPEECIEKFPGAQFQNECTRRAPKIKG